MRSTALKSFLFLIIATAFTCNAVAQNARVQVQVYPPEAYVFADGAAMGSGHRTLELAPGKHLIGVYTYGFTPQVREVDLVAGSNPKMDFSLERAGNPVNGPFGVIQIEGAPHAAVLLNGKQPEYFVAHGDEVNNHIWWKQQLLVPPGSHEVTLLSGKDELWSGKVQVEPNTRVVIHVVYSDQPKMAVKTWTEGAKISSAPRFSAGIASTTIAVAPVTATMAIDPKQINCSEPAKLAWNTTETLHTAINSEAEKFPEVTAAGDKTVSPRQTTTYHLNTSGPGGVLEKSETLNVNPVVETSLNSTPEVHYLKVGDTVLRQDPVTLTWNTKNADNIQLESIGNVNAEGSQTLKLEPEKGGFGEVNETKTYKLSASNVCGGSDVKESTVRLIGLVEPMISSVFFPTAYPDRGHPTKGLLISQQEQLKRLATIFKAYLEAVPDAKLALTGTADPRGTKPYNKRLSERRVSIVKDFLIAQGISPEAISGEAKGEEAPLDKDAVEQLEANNPQHPAADRVMTARAKRLAYNRRADVTIGPAALESARFYPHEAADSELLYKAERVRESKIIEASTSEAVVASK
jgi:hypothetical protein